MLVKERSLKLCTLTFLEKTFALAQVKNLPALQDWLTQACEISAFEQQHLLYLREILEFNFHDWNEAELDSHFIGPLFTLVNYSSIHFNHFAQRDIEAVIEEWRLFGKPDGIIASGRREPEKPFFAFQEYKRFLDPDGDPAGQALGAMLVGQALNEPTLPIYGCYVVGHDWWFMTLAGKSYAISQDFSAITDDIFAIFRILKTLKMMIIVLTTEPGA